MVQNCGLVSCGNFQNNIENFKILSKNEENKEKQNYQTY